MSRETEQRSELDSQNRRGRHEQSWKRANVAGTLCFLAVQEDSTPVEMSAPGWSGWGETRGWRQKDAGVVEAFIEGSRVQQALVALPGAACPADILGTEPSPVLEEK